MATGSRLEASAAFANVPSGRSRASFAAEEQEVAWAAAHNARWEVPHGDPRVSGAALRAPAAERLRRANA